MDLKLAAFEDVNKYECNVLSARYRRMEQMKWLTTLGLKGVLAEALHGDLL